MPPRENLGELFMICLETASTISKEGKWCERGATNWLLCLSSPALLVDAIWSVGWDVE